MKSVAVCKMKSLKPFTFNFTWPQLDSFGIFVKRACIVQLQCSFECTQLSYIKIKYLVCFFLLFRTMCVCVRHCAIQCLFIRFALLTIIIALIIKQALFFDHSINIFSHFVHTTRVPTESTIACIAMMQSYQNTQQMFT